MIRIILLFIATLFLVVTATKNSLNVTSSLRFNLIHSSSLYNEEYNLGTELIGFSSIFLINVTIGNPRKQQLLLLDTGSSLTWIKCRPCNQNRELMKRLFNPRASSTYKSLPCGTDFCRDDFFCATNSNTCRFNQTYLDESNFVGVMSSDEFTFAITDSYDKVMSNVIFGCAHKFSEISPYNGILGLGDHPVSLLRQFDMSQFSFCLGTIQDHTYNYSQLHLGERSIIKSTSMLSLPFYIRGDNYYVELQGISLDNIRIASDVFQRKFGGFDLFFDTGATYTRLPTILHESLVTEIDNKMLGTRPRYHYPGDPDRVCYYGDLHEDLEQFHIDLIFHFEDDVDFTSVNINNIFGAMVLKGTDIFCLTTYPFDRNHVIIGAYAMQYHYMAYDLAKERIYFESMDCQELGDDYL